MADYQFKYSPLTGRLTGNQMIEQTEQAINQLSSLVDSAAGQVEIISTLANEANENAATALEVANEALATTGRTYLTVSTQTDANNYYDSQLIYIADSTSTNIPVADTGMLEAKTNDNKTACEQVFIADSSGEAYYRNGAITAETVGDVTTYSVTWGGWSSEPASQAYVQSELANYAPLESPDLTGTPTIDGVPIQSMGFPIGHEYFTINPNIPQGSLPLFGGEYSRETYADLWAWVQEQTGYLKTEAEWQALASANNGNVPYYSSGNGNSTFRVPSLKCWVKAADGTITEVGSYKAAGLPNINGTVNPSVMAGNGGDIGTFVKESSGAFGHTNTSSYSYGFSVASISSPPTKNTVISLDASRSSSIYGNSTTVQPESVVGMWLVKAWGVVIDTGVIDEQQYIDDRLATRLPIAGGTMLGNIAWGQGEIGYRATTHTSPYDPCKQLIVTAGTVSGEWNDGNAKLALHTYDSTGTNTAENGAFVLQASNGTNAPYLEGKPNGSLAWDGNEVATNKLTTTTVSMSPLGNGSFTIQKIGRICFFIAQSPFQGSALAANAYSNVTAKIPSGFRPHSLVVQEVMIAVGAVNRTAALRIDTNGSIQIYNYGAALTGTPTIFEIVPYVCE